MVVNGRPSKKVYRFFSLVCSLKILTLVQLCQDKNIPNKVTHLNSSSTTHKIINHFVHAFEIYVFIGKFFKGYSTHDFRFFIFEELIGSTFLDRIA